ncbi:MAG: glycosyltransferase [Actinomycetota bacterium]
MSSRTPVSVVVPVYRDVDDVRRCLESVVRHAPELRTPFELLVIDDDTPEPAVREYLDDFAARRFAFPVRLLRNERNLGFVGTMNRGLRETVGDVVMLNADTVVTAGWLDRLADLAAGPDVATVTPVTNHGSICTLPDSVIAAFALHGTEPRIDECAGFVRDHALGLAPEVITGVGFCMYTTRLALDRGGLLDEAAFGRGYGEEVDFCLRVTRMGMRHLVDDGTFIYHRGGGSFGDEQAEGWARSAAVIHERYPYFRPTNQRERTEEPTLVAFTALELALRERDPSRPHVLHVLHSRPGDRGGTEKFVEALTEALDDEIDFCVSYPVPNGLAVRTHWRVPDAGGVVHEEFLLPGGGRPVTSVTDPVMGAAYAMAVDLFGFDAIHIHNLIGSSLAPLAALRDFPGPVSCSVHDLYLACPNFSLLYKRVESCGIPESRDVCASCLAEIAEQPMPGSPMIPELGLPYLDEHRARTRADLDVVDHWVFASRSVADTFARVYEIDAPRSHLIEHGSVIPLGRRGRGPDVGLVHDEPLRVAFVGLGWSKKGLDVVNHLADALAERSVEIHHFGELKESASPFIHAHGPYDNAVLPELLRRAGIQIVLLPGPYAETFGIVMTEALAAGIPVIGAVYGALGERIRASGAGWTIDPLDPEALVALVDRLDRCRDEVMRATERVYRVRLHTVAETADRYRALYTGPSA